MDGYQWYDAKKYFPTTSRTVVMRFDDDGMRDAEGFFWRAEVAWYRNDSGKHKRHSVHPVAWREVSDTKRQPSLFE